MTDPECSPPIQVCELGQCVPGCAQPGGIQCSGNTVCNAGTGRCDPGQAVCTNDAACGAPANICNLNTGQCVPGCAQTGCTAPDVCNQGTGHCEPPNVGAQLNEPCTVNGDCASRVCFNLEGVGNRCVKSCGSSTDCPASFTCYDYNGAKMCLASAVFPAGTTFATPAGGTCANGGQCRTNFCDQNRCVETCNNNSDCGGTGCRWQDLGGDNWITACLGPAGAGAQGANCSNNNQCTSGICFQNACADACGTTGECPSGRICGFLDASICTFSVFGNCVSWIPNFIRACIPATHGTQPPGAACTNFQPCRSGLCFVGNSLNQCTDVCSDDANCPGTHRCKVTQYGQLSDGTDIFINVCLPADF
jgi:hypothetical protein